MKILIVFNHPAPYKVRLFNALSKEIDLDVIFERKKASDRPADFYNENHYDFNAIFLKHGAFWKENSNTGELVKYLKEHVKESDIVLTIGAGSVTQISHEITFPVLLKIGKLRTSVPQSHREMGWS